MYNLTFLDVSQFVSEPLRTGVQRVLVKVLEHMPREKIIPFKVLDADHVGILDPAIFDMFIGYFQATRPSQRAVLAERHGKRIAVTESEWQIKFVGQHPLAVLQAERFFARVRRVVNLEAFSTPVRSRFYASCAESQRHKIFHFIHDFLLFDKPCVFPQLNWRYASDYVLLFEAYCAAGGFIVSTPEMAQKVSHYLNRPIADVQVVHFGGDVVADVPCSKSRNETGKRRVVVVGTIEPRKYPLVVARALELIGKTIADTNCLWIGNWGWVDSETRGAIEAIFAGGYVEHQTGVGDADMAAIMRDADVGVYVSSAEGFGLPVIEFAALGVPLVTNDTVPAAALVPHENCIVLKTVDVDDLASAITRFLNGDRKRTSYYSWTWKDTAEEIFNSPIHPGSIEESVISDLACWRSSIRLVRDLRGSDLDWEQLKKEVARLLRTDKQLISDVFLGDPSKCKAERHEFILEMMSEIVSDNRSLVHWADFMQVRPLLSDLLRSIAAENHFDGVSRAYTAFLGRLIDGRAAAEAVRLTDRSQAFRRMVELVNSDEAGHSLGDAAVTAIRTVVGHVSPIISACLASHLDLLGLMELLKMPTPSLKDVILAEDLVRSGVDRLELLSYFIAQRPVIGDHIDLVLEEIAKGCLERGPQLNAVSPGSDSIKVGVVKTPFAGSGVDRIRANGTHGANGINEAKGINGTATNLVEELLPRSFMREVSIYSEAYFDGWYPVEYAGKNVFRWMGRTGSVVNPDKSRAVEDFVLDIQDVYGAHEPMVTAYMDETRSRVEIVPKKGEKGWQLRLSVEGEDTHIHVVRLQALASDSPSQAEGSADERQLSLCITGATFIYRV